MLSIFEGESILMKDAHTEDRSASIKSRIPSLKKRKEGFILGLMTIVSNAPSRALGYRVT